MGLYKSKYRTTAILKIEKDIIVNISVSPTLLFLSAMP